MTVFIALPGGFSDDYRPSESSKATRARTSTSTPAAPPARSVSAQAESVAPEVSTSSTSSTPLAGERAGAPRRHREGAGLVRRAARRARRPAASSRGGASAGRARPAGRCRARGDGRARPTGCSAARRRRRQCSGTGATRSASASSGRPAARHPARRAAAPCRGDRRASAPAPPSARRRRRGRPRRRGPRPADGGCSSRRRPRRRPRRPAARRSCRQVVPAMKCVSRQQAAQRPCARVGRRGAGEAARRIDACRCSAGSQRAASMAFAAVLSYVPARKETPCRPRPPSSTPTCSPAAATAPRGSAGADFLHGAVAGEIAERLKEVNRSVSRRRRSSVRGPALWAALLAAERHARARAGARHRRARPRRGRPRPRHPRARRCTGRTIRSASSSRRGARCAPDGLLHRRALRRRDPARAARAPSPRPRWRRPAASARAWRRWARSATSAALLQRAGLRAAGRRRPPLRRDLSPTPLALMRDLRAMGETNVMRDRAAPADARGRCSPRRWTATMPSASGCRTGGCRRRFDVIFLTGWAPRRGPAEAAPPRLRRGPPRRRARRRGAERRRAGARAGGATMETGR